LSDCNNPHQIDFPGGLEASQIMRLREFKKAYKSCGILRFSLILDFILPGIGNISLVFIAFCDL